MHELSLIGGQKTTKKSREESVEYKLGNETIIQPAHGKRVRQISGKVTAGNIFAGVLIGAAIVWFLIVPSVDEAKVAKAKQNKQVVEYSNRINALEAQVSAQTKTLDEYRAQDSDKEAQAQSAASTSESYENLMTVSSQYESGEYSDAQTKTLDEYRAQDSDKEAQAQSAASTSESYENLMTVSSQYESGEYSDATLADTLLNVNRDALGQSGQALYDELSTEIFPGACETKYQNGMAALNVANYETAIDALGKVVRMDEQYDSGAALLNLGIAYMRSGDNENAKTYFNRVAELFPGTENEATAKSNLNSMSDTAADDTKTADDTQE